MLYILPTTYWWAWKQIQTAEIIWRNVCYFSRFRGSNGCWDFASHSATNHDETFDTYLIPVEEQNCLQRNRQFLPPSSCQHGRPQAVRVEAVCTLSLATCRAPRLSTQQWLMGHQSLCSFRVTRRGTNRTLDENFNLPSTCTTLSFPRITCTARRVMQAPLMMGPPPNAARLATDCTLTLPCNTLMPV